MGNLVKLTEHQIRGWMGNRGSKRHRYIYLSINTTIIIIIIIMIFVIIIIIIIIIVIIIIIIIINLVLLFDTEVPNLADIKGAEPNRTLQGSQRNPKDDLPICRWMGSFGYTYYSEMCM